MNTITRSGAIGWITLTVIVVVVLAIVGVINLF